MSNLNIIFNNIQLNNEGETNRLGHSVIRAIWFYYFTVIFHTHRPNSEGAKSLIPKSPLMEINIMYIWNDTFDLNLGLISVTRGKNEQHSTRINEYYFLIITLWFTKGLGVIHTFRNVGKYHYHGWQWLHYTSVRCGAQNISWLSLNMSTISRGRQ